MSSTSKESLLALIREYYIHNNHDNIPVIQIENWEEVMEIASKHGVVGLCLESLEKLPKESRPAKDTLLNLIGITTQLEAQYNLHLKVLKKLSDYFHKNGITTILLKGYSLSLNYHVPNHRPSGDIDLFLSDGRRADELIKAMGIEVKQNEEKHSTFSFNGIHVENHATVICELEHKSLSNVERFLENELKEHSVFDDVSGCILPSALFNAVYLPLHLGGHFVYGGANLRQILDYGLMVKKSTVGSINWEIVKRLAEEGGFFNFICCLNGICIEHLGIDSEHFPDWKRDRNLEKKILDDVLTAHTTASASVFGKVKRFIENRWKYKLVYGKENHSKGFFLRIRSWFIWKWGIGRNNVWDK